LPRSIAALWELAQKQLNEGPLMQFVGCDKALDKPASLSPETG
jgi:hypothetical protein